jgi:hypothetical protein
MEVHYQGFGRALRNPGPCREARCKEFSDGAGRSTDEGNGEENFYG